jgi:hypothetical protein
MIATCQKEAEEKQRQLQKRHTEKEAEKQRQEAEKQHGKRQLCCRCLPRQSEAPEHPQEAEAAELQMIATCQKEADERRETAEAAEAPYEERGGGRCSARQKETEKENTSI